LELAERPLSLNEQQWRRNRASWIASSCLHAGALGLAALAVTAPDQLEIEIARGQSVTIELCEPKTEQTQAVSFEVDLLADESDLPIDVPDERVAVLEKLNTFELQVVPDAKMEPDPHVEMTVFAVTPVHYQHDVAPKAPGSTAAKRQKIKSSVALAGFTASPGNVSLVRVDEGAKFSVPPKKLPENKPPVYPDREQRAGIEGRVLLIASIGSNGRVARLAVHESSGSVRLDKSAMDAVMTWRFSPALRDGDPVEAEILVPIRFAIRSS
jgi:TonB family protein